ncbi:formyltransferase family protein [Streptomyces sp. MS2.AVA.5]|uniref:Formyltransferase family protein n=1 Tax=Streptomyces achmelvichensis TaxID=3134111 RepID=A0ACC6Q8E6_9ACTN
MIFVGEGSLLWRAVQHTLDSNLPVDMVCSPAGAEPAARPNIPFRAVTDINAIAAELTTAGTDGVVWSLNNRMIFRAPMLSAGLRILNIHHGPLPAYRGMPEVALVYAMLRGEREYAATLHQVDEGIDTGPTLASETYPIVPDEPYHVVLRRGLRVCHELFVRSLPLVDADPAWAGEPTLPSHNQGAGYYGRKALALLPGQRDHPDFARATDLGFLAGYLPDLAAALR